MAAEKLNRHLANDAVTHSIIQEALSGKVVDWMEKVMDEDCQK
jgi:hypothetical protein